MPLFALHGFTGSPQSWDFLPEPAFAPALVGHAGSTAGAEIRDFEAEVDRLAGLIPSGDPVHAQHASCRYRQSPPPSTARL